MTIAIAGIVVAALPARADVELAGDDVGEEVVAAAANDDRPGAGRTRFVIASTAASLYGGLALVDILDQPAGPVAGAVALGTLGAGVGISLAASSRLPLTQGAADGYVFGLAHGGLNSLLLTLAADRRGDSALTWSLVGIAGGGLVGYRLARAGDATAGQVRFSANASVFGTTTAGFALGVARPQAGPRAVPITLLGGLNAGAITGMALSRDLDWSARRANYVLLGAGLGGITGLSLSPGISVLATGKDFDDRDLPDQRALQIMSAGVLGGMWAGIALGTYLTRNMSPAARYRDDASAAVTIAPLEVAGGGGLSLVGQF